MLFSRLKTSHATRTNGPHNILTIRKRMMNKNEDVSLYLDTRNSIDDAQNLFYSTQMPTTSKTTELSSLKV